MSRDRTVRGGRAAPVGGNSGNRGAKAGRKATGIELNPRWIEIYRQVCRQENLEEEKTIQGDCLEVMDAMAAEGQLFDLVATDPPYSIALEKTLSGDRFAQEHANRRTDLRDFSDDPRDFRNLGSFEDYYQAMHRMANRVHPLLKPGGYFVLIIRDSYQNGEYVMASYEICRRLQAVGFVLKGIKIWYGTGARVRPYGYPYAFVPNIVHQNILVFRR